LAEVDRSTLKLQEQKVADRLPLLAVAWSDEQFDASGSGSCFFDSWPSVETGVQNSW
jgi:hypothetical protein